MSFIVKWSGLVQESGRLLQCWLLMARLHVTLMSVVFHVTPVYTTSPVAILGIAGLIKDSRRNLYFSGS